MDAVTLSIGGKAHLVRREEMEEYRAQHAAARRALEAIYERFDPLRPDRLASREGEIVDAVNRYNELSDIIDGWAQAEKREENVLAGWLLVKQLRTGGET